MTLHGGHSIPISEPKWWMHTTTGWYWHERRFHRGRIVLALRGRVGHEIRMRPEELRENPWWIRSAPPRNGSLPLRNASESS